MAPPMCTDYFNCSLPKEKRTAKHKKLYHDPQPTEIKTTDGSHAKILVQRDPKRAMYFPCPHKECDHASILRTTPAKHHKRCHLFKRDQLAQRKQKATATAGAATHALTRCSSSLSSVSTLSSAPSCSSQGLDSDDVTPSRATRQSESNDSRSPPPSPEPFTCASAADVHQLLLSMAFLAQTIDHLDGRVGVQEELTKRMTASRSNAARITKLEECIERISDQGDWLMAEVHNQKKCAETFKRTVGSDMATVENHMEAVKEHLLDLVPGNHKLKKQVKELQESMAQLRATLRDIVNFD